MEQRNINVFTVDDVAQILQVGRSKAYEIFKREDFPSFYVGRHLRVAEIDLIKWLSNQGK